MQEFITQNISLFIFGIDILGTAIWIVACILTKRSTQKKIERCTERVNGIAYDVFWTGEGLGDKRVRFRYYVDGVMYEGIYPIILNSSKISVEKNQVVELFYNPLKPKEYIFKELDLIHSKHSFILSIIGAVFTFVFLTIIAIIFNSSKM